MKKDIQQAKETLRVIGKNPDNLDLVKTMIILKESFRSVGHLFLECVDCGIKSNALAGVSAVYNSFNFIPLAHQAEQQGEELFRFLLSRKLSDLCIRPGKLEIAMQEGAKINNEAMHNVCDFLTEGFTDRLVKYCLEYWENCCQNPFCFAKHQGVIKVFCFFKVLECYSEDKYRTFASGGLDLIFNLTGEPSNNTVFFTGTKCTLSFQVLNALSTGIEIKRFLPIRGGRRKIIFKFPFQPVHYGQLGRNSLIRAWAIDGLTNLVVPAYKASLNIGKTDGDLHRIPEQF